MVLAMDWSKLKLPRNWFVMLVFAVPGPPTSKTGYKTRKRHSQAGFWSLPSQDLEDKTMGTCHSKGINLTADTHHISKRNPAGLQE